MEAADRRTGTIKSIVSGKGYGFIVDDDGGTERFFHRSGLVDGTFGSLREGQSVTFRDESSDRGPRATAVKVRG